MSDEDDIRFGSFEEVVQTFGKLLWSVYLSMDDTEPVTSELPPDETK